MLFVAPAEFFFTQKYMWLYFAEPDAGIAGRSENLVQGRCLGGGSGVHAMLYCRGAASVFDEWAQISGNPGLKWNSMLQSFRATTHWTDEASIKYKQPVNTAMFGHGPLEISRQRELLAFDKPFADKLQKEFNLPEIDSVSGVAIGVSQSVESIRASNRTRSYAYNTFGYLASTRPNFKLLTGAWASKIGFTGKTADSVVYNDTATGTMKTIRAKEIILASGTIKTPQLLMLSGVGPADTLKKFNIPLVQDSPQVGQNMYDHHYAVLQYAATPEEGTVWQWHDNATRAAIERAKYAKNGDGLLGTNDGDVYGALRLPDSVFEGTGSFHKNLPADRPHMIYEYTTTPFLANSPNVSIIALFMAVVQPESKGYTTLATADYRDAPKIFSNYWGTPGDRAAVTYGYKQVRSLMGSPELSNFTTQELFPGVQATSDDDIWSAIQQSSQSWHHPVGTAAIGSVLDANWRVKGVKGLRVVGMAAAPKITTCGTQATAYAIGHRAAVDIAKADGVCKNVSADA